MISFDEATHTYSDEKGMLPSVTQIIEAVGLKSTAFYKPGSAEKGKTIHRILHELDLGKPINWEEAEEYIGYIEAWTEVKKSLAESVGFKVFSSECIGSHTQKRYAGTADKIATFKDKQYNVWDIKTGKREKWHRLQVSAYTDMMMSTHLEREWSMPHIAYLREDGTFIIEDVDDYQDLIKVWDACVTVYYWGRK